MIVHFEYKHLVVHLYMFQHTIYVLCILVLHLYTLLKMSLLYLKCNDAQMRDNHTVCLVHTGIYGLFIKSFLPQNTKYKISVHVTKYLYAEVYYQKVPGT
jgi:hypothetical protein